VDLAVREVVRPRSIREALALLEERPESAPIAGGTDLVVQLRDGRRRVTTLIDLGALGLAGIRVSNGGIEIGAGTHMDAIAADPHVRRLHPALAASAGQVGAWPIQCRATLGGNLANASPAADTAPALIVGAATLVIVSTGGTRRLPVEEFFVGPGRSALTRGELIVAVELPSPAAARGARVVERFAKVGPRREQIVSVVSLAGRALVRADGTLAEVRLALGSVAPTPIRARRAERAVEGRRPTPDARRGAAVALEADIAPIDDVRAPARYRRLAAAVLLDRFLAEVGDA
jgi:carbon-monoxide dehydrogenase medium subunit